MEDMWKEWNGGIMECGKAAADFTSAMSSQNASTNRCSFLGAERRSSVLVISSFERDWSFCRGSSILAASPILTRSPVLSGSPFGYVEIVRELPSIDTRTTTAIVRGEKHRVRSCHFLSLLSVPGSRKLRTGALADLVSQASYCATRFAGF